MSEHNPMVSITIGDRDWILIDAGRTPSGLGLGYFAAGGADGDRRVALDPGTDVGRMSPEEIESLFASGAPLTATERRLRDPDGELWLAQAVGPVWAEGGVATDAVGVRLRCLTARRPSVRADGRPLDAFSDEELLLLARSPREDGSDG